MLVPHVAPTVAPEDGNVVKTLPLPAKSPLAILALLIIVFTPVPIPVSLPKVLSKTVQQDKMEQTFLGSLYLESCCIVALL